MAVDLVDNNAFVQQIIDKGIAEAGNRNTDGLGKQDFLNLLILQLRYQDPLNPVEDKEFIAQMAQFSALEQMQAMNASNTAMKGFSMIGKYVSALFADSITGQTQKVEGHVESVTMNGSKTYVVVGGKEIPIESIYNVADGYNPLNSTLSAYTGLLGYLIKGAVFDLTTGEIVGVNGVVKSLEKGSYEDYALLDGVNAIIAGINKNGDIIEDRAKIKEYLEGFDDIENPEDRHIEVFITDENGKRVPIGATLRSYVYDPVYGTIKAVLDDVAVPVASVASIKNTPAAAAGEQQESDDGDIEPEGIEAEGIGADGTPPEGDADDGEFLDGVGADGAPLDGVAGEDTAPENAAIGENQSDTAAGSPAIETAGDGTQTDSAPAGNASIDGGLENGQQPDAAAGAENETSGDTMIVEEQTGG